MNSLDKRRLWVATGGIALVAGYSMSGPIADVRITRDIAAPSISWIETRIDLGFVAFSYLRRWNSPSP